MVLNRHLLSNNYIIKVMFWLKVWTLGSRILFGLRDFKNKQAFWITISAKRGLLRCLKKSDIAWSCVILTSREIGFKTNPLTQTGRPWNENYDISSKRNFQVIKSVCIITMVLSNESFIIDNSYAKFAVCLDIEK